MSRAKPASAESVVGVPIAADVLPKVENRPIANASAPTSSTASAMSSQRRAPPPLDSPSLWLTEVLLLAGGVDASGARRARLGGVLAAPVLLEELRDARV